MKALLLAFANHRENPLPTLAQEDDAIYGYLGPGATKGHFLPVRESFATVGKLADYITQNRENLWLFHYGGHSGRDTLLLEDKEAHAGGIAQMLGRCPNLTLVVLNGCATGGQVDALLEAGVRAVIATSAPVNDTLATEFSKTFYKALTEYASIEEAFDLAKGAVNIHTEGTAWSRDKIWKGIPGDSASPSWGLFYKAGKEEALEQKLPKNKPLEIPTDFEPNVLLIDTLWDSLKAYSDAIAMLDSGRKTLKTSRKRMAILNNLPAPVAEHLRKLMVPVPDEDEGYDNVSLARLKQLATAFQTLMELVTFTLLAQLWENKFANKDISLPEGLSGEMHSFLSMTENDREALAFLPMIRGLRTFLDEMDIPYFVEELKDLSQLTAMESPFRNACIFFDILRNRLKQSGVADVEIPELCIRAETSLANIFSQLGFLGRYTLATVNHIDVEKYRHTPDATFRHALVRMVDLLGGLEEEEEVMDVFMDNRSVLLLKEEDDQISGFLNLSPFIIDGNAFEEKTDKSKIYFFHHRDGDGNHCFRFINKPEDVPLKDKDKKYKIINDQFHAFINTFGLNKTG